jgi:hypothetical protein
MGWSDCGTDSQGRPIGYAWAATCDYPGCDAEIHRGLSYACGEMHGDGDGFTCERYFCEAHRRGLAPDADGRMVSVCEECEAEWRAACPEEAEAYDNR